MAIPGILTAHFESFDRLELKEVGAIPSRRAMGWHFEIDGLTLEEAKRRG